MDSAHTPALTRSKRKTEYFALHLSLGFAAVDTDGIGSGKAANSTRRVEAALDMIS
jgi:hypothetical protein